MNERSLFYHSLFLPFFLLSNKGLWTLTWLRFLPQFTTVQNSVARTRQALVTDSKFRFFFVWNSWDGCLIAFSLVGVFNSSKVFISLKKKKKLSGFSLLIVLFCFVLKKNLPFFLGLYSLLLKVIAFAVVEVTFLCLLLHAWCVFFNGNVFSVTCTFGHCKFCLCYGLWVYLCIFGFYLMVTLLLVATRDWSVGAFVVFLGMQIGAML